MGHKLILLKDFKEDDFLKIIKKMKHGRNCIRLLATHHIQLGKSLKIVSRIAQSHCITVQQWLKKFNSSFDKIFLITKTGLYKI